MLVFGKTTDLMSDYAPVECQPWEHSFRYVEHLKSRQQALVNHLSIKASHDLRTILLRKATPSSEPKSVGQWVYLLRSGEFFGPGQVAHALGQQCSVKIGNRYLNCHFSDLIPLTDHELRQLGQELRLDPGYNQEPQHKSQHQQQPQEQHGQKDQGQLRDGQERVQGHDSQQNSQVLNYYDTENENSGYNNSIQDVPVQLNDTVPLPQAQDQPHGQNQGQPHVQGNQHAQHQDPRDATNRFKKGDQVQIFLEDTWKEAVIVSRYKPNTNKLSAKYRYKFRNEDGSVSKVYWEDFNVVNWRYAGEGQDQEQHQEDHQQVLLEDVGEDDEADVHQVLATIVPYQLHGRPDVIQAKRKELEGLAQFESYQEVNVNSLSKDQKAKMIHTSWVVVEKGVPGNTRTKARLCARGDREHNVKDIRTDCPTGSKLGLRLLLSVAASNNWHIKSIDFKNAFLQGMELDRELFMMPPKEARQNCPDVVWKLVKPIYGLVDSPRNWYLKLHQELTALNMEQSNLDQALYYIKDKKGQLKGILLVHVDDMIYAGLPEFDKTIMEPIMSKYTISAEEVSSFCFTGWNLTQNQDGIVMDQKDYMKNLDLSKFKALQAPSGSPRDLVDQDTQEVFRKGIGTLGWITSVSKPNLSYYTTHFAAKVMRATVKDAKLMYRTLVKAANEPSTIKFSNLGPIAEWKVVTFCDASWTRAPDFESIHANVTCIVGSNGKSNILDWQATHPEAPASSAMASEADSCLLALGKLKMLKFLVDEIFETQIQGNLVTDSLSVQKAVHSTTTIKDKRMYISIASLRSLKKEDKIKIVWTSSEKQLSDCLTKPGANTEKLLNLMTQSQLDLVE